MVTVAPDLDESSEAASESTNLVSSNPNSEYAEQSKSTSVLERIGPAKEKCSRLLDIVQEKWSRLPNPAKAGMIPWWAPERRPRPLGQQHSAGCLSTRLAPWRLRIRRARQQTCRSPPKLAACRCDDADVVMWSCSSFRVARRRSEPTQDDAARVRQHDRPMLRCDRGLLNVRSIRGGGIWGSMAHGWRGERTSSVGAGDSLLSSIFWELSLVPSLSFGKFLIALRAFCTAAPSGGHGARRVR